MRLFNTDEQKIIGQLVKSSIESQTYLPICLFDDIFHGQNVGFDGRTNPMRLSFPYVGSGKPSADDIIKIYNNILSRVLLIDYLEKEGLVYIIPMQATVNTTYTHGRISTPNVVMDINQGIGNNLIKYINQPIYVSSTLVEYVKSGFKSLEEQALEEAKKQSDEAKKQSCYSRIAILISLMALLLNGLMPLFLSNKNETNNQPDLTVPIKCVKYIRFDTCKDSVVRKVANK